MDDFTSMDGSFPSSDVLPSHSLYQTQNTYSLQQQNFATTGTSLDDSPTLDLTEMVPDKDIVMLDHVGSNIYNSGSEYRNVLPQSMIIDPDEVALYSSHLDVSNYLTGTDPLTMLPHSFQPLNQLHGRTTASGDLLVMASLQHESLSSSADAERLQQLATMLDEHRPLSEQQSQATNWLSMLQNSSREEQDAIAGSLMSQISNTFEEAIPPRLVTAEKDKPNTIWSTICLWNMQQLGGSQIPIVPPKPVSVVMGPEADGDGQGIGFLSGDVKCSRQALQEFRYNYYRNACNISPNIERSEQYRHATQQSTTPFRFTRTHGQAIAKQDHYQLRHLMAVHSLHDVFYPRLGKVYNMDPMNRIGTREKPNIVMDIERLDYNSIDGCRITTLNKVGEELLFVGNMKGHYGYCNIYSNDSDPKVCATGRAGKYATLYIDSTPNSPSGPRACISVNDYTATQVLLDCPRNQILKKISYVDDLKCITSPKQATVNCTATAPDGRLRACVGDFHSMLLTDARTGAAVDEFPGFTTDSLAVAWADDNHTVATGSEDNQVRIWDVRTWKVIRSFSTEMSSCRSLHFSRLGAGPLTLFAGENVDLVHVVDVRTTEHVQLLKYLGDHGGMGVTPCGTSLVIANTDPSFGGMMVYDRTEWMQPVVEDNWAME